MKLLGARIGTFLIGLLITAASGALVVFLWYFGDPPSASVLWPRETGTVASSAVTSIPRGSSTYAQVDVEVKTARGREPLSGIDWERLGLGNAADEAARLSSGTRLTLMRGPDGRVHEVGFVRASAFLFAGALVVGFLGVMGGTRAMTLALSRDLPVHLAAIDARRARARREG